MNLQRHIWEGWTVQGFINELEPTLDMIMNNRSHVDPIKDKTALKEWCKNNQPYYKKYIPEVVTYFAKKFNLK